MARRLRTRFTVAALKEGGDAGDAQGLELALLRSFALRCLWQEARLATLLTRPLPRPVRARMASAVEVTLP